MKILLTGATGFIGKHLYQDLCKNQYEVFILHRPTSNVAHFDKRHCICYNGNLKSLVLKLKRELFDGIIHLASFVDSSPVPSCEKIQELLEANLIYSTNLLYAAVESSVKWFINTGSTWQNYQAEDFSDSYNPLNLYAATKQAFQVIARYYIETNSINFVTLKLCDTYGPNDTRKKIIHLFEENAKTNEILDMSPGDQRISIVHVDDVVKAYLLLISAMQRNEIVNGTEFTLNSRQMPTLKELASIFEQTRKCKLNIKWGGREYRMRENMNPYKGTPPDGWEPLNIELN